MNLNYLCPICNSYINLGNWLLFSVKTSGGHTGIIALDTEIGNYDVVRNDNLDYLHGDKLDFFCPVCHEALSSERHSSLAKIIMEDEHKNRFEILFSQVAGKKSTYKITGATMEMYGDDSAEYLDFLNLSLNL